MDDAMLLWHVTVTVAGDPQDASSVHSALVRLQAERPFMHSMRYDEERAEICYWDEGEDMLDAASLALRMWGEHRLSAGLPDWKVVGLEVVERDTYQSRLVTVPVAGADAQPRPF